MYKDFIRDSPEFQHPEMPYYFSHNLVVPIRENVVTQAHITALSEDLGVQERLAQEGIPQVSIPHAFSYAAASFEDVVTAFKSWEVAQCVADQIPDRYLVHADKVIEPIEKVQSCVSYLETVSPTAYGLTSSYLKLLQELLSKWDLFVPSTSYARSEEYRVGELKTYILQLRSYTRDLSSLIRDSDSDGPLKLVITTCFNQMREALRVLATVLGTGMFPALHMWQIWVLALATTQPGPDAEYTSLPQYQADMEALVFYLLMYISGRPVEVSSKAADVAHSKKYKAFVHSGLHGVFLPLLPWGNIIRNVPVGNCALAWLFMLHRYAHNVNTHDRDTPAVHTSRLQTGAIGYPPSIFQQGVLHTTKPTDHGVFVGIKGPCPVTRGTLEMPALAERGLPQHCDLMQVGVAAYKFELPLFWGVAPGGLPAVYIPADPEVRSILVRAYGGKLPSARVPSSNVISSLTGILEPQSVATFMSLLEFEGYPPRKEGKEFYMRPRQKYTFSTGAARVDIRKVLGAPITDECSQQDTFIRMGVSINKATALSVLWTKTFLSQGE